jgi:hypothetical protein
VTCQEKTVVSKISFVNKTIIPFDSILTTIFCDVKGNFWGILGTNKSAYSGGFFRGSINHCPLERRFLLHYHNAIKTMAVLVMKRRKK